MKLKIIHTSTFKVDGGAMFGVIPKTLWNKVYPSDENNLCTLANKCFLIETNNRIFLIDTGIGDKVDEKTQKFYSIDKENNIVNELEKNNYSINDITDVILTHLHWDHCGGATIFKDGKLFPTFPNATYHLSLKQYERAIKPNIRESAAFKKENFLPLVENNLINFITNNTKLNENIELRLFDGHTPGLISVIIKVNDKTIVIPSDLIPTSANIPLTWISAYDNNPETVLEEKESLLLEAYYNNFLIFFQHDYFHDFCNLKLTDKGIRENQFFKLNDLFLASES